ASVWGDSTFLDCKPDYFGIYNSEYQQAKNLGEKWGLSGHWGDKNRLHGTGNWSPDDSVLTTEGDCSGEQYIVTDANNVPQYRIEKIQTPQGVMFLPFLYLKRPEFFGARRVFFPPEENIAIWYLAGFCNVPKIMIVHNPDLMLKANIFIEAIVGCIPGGKAAIAKTDFATLRGREIWIFINNPKDRDEVEFVVTLTARLRREYMTSHTICNMNGAVRELYDHDLASLAEQNSIFVPDELRREYLGDLTNLIAKYVPTSIIDGILNAGEVICIQEHDLPTLLLALHFAAQLSTGCNVFGEWWPVKGKKTMLAIIDHEDIAFAAKYFAAGRIADCRIADCRIADCPINERQRAFAALRKSAEVVIIAAKKLLTMQPDACGDVIQACLNKHVGVVLVSDTELLPEVKRCVSKTFTANRLDGKGDLTIALADQDGKNAVKATFDGAGKCISAHPMSEKECDGLTLGKTVASLPPSDISQLEAFNIKDVLKDNKLT
ncbi:MAG: hypothetical protein RR051_02400, partial [Clostridiales bacterium]